MPAAGSAACTEYTDTPDDRGGRAPPFLQREQGDDTMTTDLTGDFELGEDEFDWDVFLPDPDEVDPEAEAAALDGRRRAEPGRL